MVHFKEVNGVKTLNEDYIQIDIQKIMEYISEILRDISVGKAYTSTIKTSQNLAWLIQDLEARTRNED